MAHKLIGPFTEEKKRFKMPSLSGRFGFSFYIGVKEVFIGLSINDIEIEKVIRRKVLRPSKGKVNIFRFD